MVDSITFQQLLNQAIHENLEMCLIDVLTAYLCGSLDIDSYMKIPKTFKFLEAQK